VEQKTADQRPAYRRPGIAAIEQRLKNQHPTWTKNRVQTEAKAEWHRVREVAA
jgi:hypothetical protein